jgi:hypothetical protein
MIDKGGIAPDANGSMVRDGYFPKGKSQTHTRGTKVPVGNASPHCSLIFCIRVEDFSVVL